MDDITLVNDGRPALAQVVEVYKDVDPRLVDLSERLAAACLNQRPKTLESWRQHGIGPRFLKFGRQVRYRLCDILEYREAQLYESSRAAMTRPKRRANSPGSRAA